MHSATRDVADLRVVPQPFAGALVTAPVGFQRQQEKLLLHLQKAAARLKTAAFHIQRASPCQLLHTAPSPSLYLPEAS